MAVTPCPLCGYDAPGTSCPHCSLAPAAPSLARRPPGLLGSVLDGLAAVPRGVAILATTRGVKRWTIPPFLLTFLAFVLLGWWLYSLVGGALDDVLPDEVVIDPESWGWVQSLSERWHWLASAVTAVGAALEWTLDQVLALSQGMLARWAVWLVIGFFVSWYLFSIAYEAMAGPFLDEIHGRLEARWFGSDPRNRLERPTDISESRTMRDSAIAGGAAALILLGGFLVPGLPFWIALVCAPLAFVAMGFVDREYGVWMRWVASVELRALWVSIQASIITGAILVLALPLYFVLPPVGPILFAGVAGFATSVSLLDIPFERRGWKLKARMRFVFRYLPALVAFGAVSGFLLTIPLLGWALMVPASSVGGLWLVCRLDKNPFRPPGQRMERAATPTARRR